MVSAPRRPPPSCRTPPPQRGKPAFAPVFANSRRRRKNGEAEDADLPRCGGGVRQDGGGRRGARHIPYGIFALAIALVSTPAHAACPVELAVYGDRDDAAGIDFRPAANLAAVTNAFRMNLDNGVSLDGMVMWSEGIERPYGSLTYECPDGDVTGEELEACTVWQGVIYAADETGTVDLLPKTGAAPKTLIFPDLGPSLRLSAAYGEDGFSRVPWDVFALKGCQE